MSERSIPLLTVIIPTRNRCEYLKRNLEILLPLADLHKGDVYIYISDNASDDDTLVVIDQAKKAYPQLVTFYRQKTNIGGLNNFLDSISKIDSEYFVLLGDDDYIMPYYFDYVLHILKGHPDVDWLCYNGTRINENNIIFSLLTTSRVNNHIRLYEDGACMVRDFLNSITLMSQNIYKRELFLRGMSQISDDVYPGYTWFAIMCFQILGKPSIYCDIPLIENSFHSNIPWSHNLPWFHVYTLGKLFRNLDEYNEEIYLEWMKTFNQQTDIKRYILKLISQNRREYKDRVPKMLPYACSKLYRCQLNIYTKYTAMLAKIFDKLLKGYAICNKNFKRPFNKKPV